MLSIGKLMGLLKDLCNVQSNHLLGQNSPGKASNANEYSEIAKSFYCRQQGMASVLNTYLIGMMQIEHLKRCLKSKLLRKCKLSDYPY